jgi:hypothetical protein
MGANSKRSPRIAKAGDRFTACLRLCRWVLGRCRYNWADTPAPPDLTVPVRPARVAGPRVHSPGLPPYACEQTNDDDDDGYRFAKTSIGRGHDGREKGKEGGEVSTSLFKRANSRGGLLQVSRFKVQ